MFSADKILFPALVALTMVSGSLISKERYPWSSENLPPPPPPKKTEQAPKSTVYVTGEYLLWHCNEEGLPFAEQGSSSGGNPVSTLEKPHFKWSSGYRAGIGYHLPHDQWDIGARWTQFSSTANGKTAPGGTLSSIIFPQWTNLLAPAPQSLITEIKAHWKLRLEIIDGGLSRVFKATPFLNLTPYIGLRGAWINQHYNTVSTGGTNDLGDAIGGIKVQQDKLVMTNKFRGVGFRGGLGSDWKFCSNWCIYGNGAVSLLYGTFHNVSKESQINAIDPTLTLLNTTKVSSHQNVAMLDLAAGVKWDYTFSNDRTALELAAGWEFNDFFDQNKFFYSVIAVVSNQTDFLLPRNEDLTMQGLVVSAKLSF